MPSAGHGFEAQPRYVLYIDFVIQYVAQIEYRASDKQPVAIISLRLPKELDEKLSLEAQRSNRPRSELARDAIALYLDRLERERFLSGMESAARTLALDSDARSEALQTTSDFLPLDNESLALGERPTPYRATPAAKLRPKRRKP